MLYTSTEPSDDPLAPRRFLVACLGTLISHSDPLTFDTDEEQPLFCILTVSESMLSDPSGQCLGLSLPVIAYPYP
jgi:hypothetical protein